MTLSGVVFVEEELEVERTALRWPRAALRSSDKEGSPGSAALGACEEFAGHGRADVRRSRPRFPRWGALEQMLLAVSPRCYARSLKPPEEIEVRGVSKSAVMSDEVGLRSTSAR